MLTLTGPRRGSNKDSRNSQKNETKASKIQTIAQENRHHYQSQSPKTSQGIKKSISENISVTLAVAVMLAANVCI